MQKFPPVNSGGNLNIFITIIVVIIIGIDTGRKCLETITVRILVEQGKHISQCIHFLRLLPKKYHKMDGIKQWKSILSFREYTSEIKVSAAPSKSSRGESLLASSIPCWLLDFLGWEKQS